MEIFHWVETSAICTPSVWNSLSQVQMLTDRTPMIHLGDDDLNLSQQISSSKATAMKSRWLRRGDKKRPTNVFLDCTSRGFEGIRWWAWQTFTFPNTENFFRTSRSSFFEVSIVNEGDDVWLHKKLRYTIRSSINKQLIHLDLLSLHRITLCHFYDSSQDPRQSIIETIYHLLDGPLFLLGSHDCSPEKRKCITLAYFI